MTALLLGLLLQDSRDVFLSERPVEVRVPVSSDGRHPASVVSFPEESLEALVAGWNETDLSVERRRENLFLKLLKPAQGDLHVLGASGRLYRLAVRPADGAYDGRVRIVLPREREAAAPEPVELIRAMRRGRTPAEGTVLRGEGVLYQSAEWTARAAWVYDGTSYRGYVVRVENVSAIPQRLDPSRFSSPDLVLAGAREMLLKPGEGTLLYLVFWKRP